MTTRLSASRPVAQLAAEIADGSVRLLFERLVDEIGNVHPDVETTTTSVEMQLSYRGELLCRLVPYKELVHVRIGEPPGWETRIRSEHALLDAIDRVLMRLLEVHAATAAA